MRAWYWAMTSATAVVLRLLADWQVEGREHVPRSGPLLVVANHISMGDPPIIAASVPRVISYMAKEELFRNGFSAWAIRNYEAFVVRRGTPDRDAVRQAVDRLAAGRAVGVFPEGTRSRVLGLRRAQPGIGLIARLSGAPILPVGITGSEAITGPGALLRHPTIAVRIGPSFDVASLGLARGAGQTQAIADAIMLRIAALLPERYRGVYGTPARPLTEPPSVQWTSAETPHRP